MKRFGRELGREVREVASEALERLRRYSWPGNIRELQSVLKQALLQASGTVLLPAFLPEVLSDRSGDGSGAAAPAQDVGLRSFIRQRLTSDASDLYEKMHREVDRIFLTLVL